MHPDAFAEWQPSDRRRPLEFTVRLGTQNDVPACVELAGLIGLDDATAWTDTLLKTVRDGTERALFVAEAQTELVGYGRAVHSQTAVPAGWYLLGVVVHPDWRRRGIGAALTRSRMQWVAERGSQIYYFTHTDNRASRALHQSFGFREVPGGWKPPGGTEADAEEQQLFVADLRDM